MTHEAEVEAFSVSALAELWVRAVAGVDADITAVPKTVEGLRQWLFETLLCGVDALYNSWNIYPPLDLELGEEEYLKRIGFIGPSVKGLGGGKRSIFLASWPKAMQAAGDYNCIGGALLCIYLLSRRSIKSYLGLLPFHLANVIWLKEAERWIYIDFTNNVERQISPKLKILFDSVPVITFPRIAFFRRAALVSPEMIVCPVIESLALVQKLATLPDSPLVNGLKERAEAQEFYEQYKPLFEQLTLSDVTATLFPLYKRIEASEIMERERQKVKDRMRAYGLPVPVGP